MLDFSWVTLALMGLLSFFAGAVDALAGGGGLIVMPTYLAAGLPPSLVLGTNKITSCIGTTMSSFQYRKRLKLPIRTFIPAIGAAFLGSLTGTALTLMISPYFLRYFLIVALPFLVYWLYFHKHAFEKTTTPAPSLQQTQREIQTAFPVGVYDGFFGPGAGAFYALALNKFCHYPLLEATGRTKILNLASNIAAVAAFLTAGKAHIALGLCMGAMNMMGSYTGSRIGVQKGSQAIKPAMLFVCSLLFVKTVWDLLAGR